MHSGLEQMQADAILAPHLAPPAGPWPVSAKTTLITGSTGFLGRFVVARLLRTTCQSLILLAREKHGIKGKDRVRDLLAEDGLDISAFSARIRVLDGDVAQEALGIDPATYRALVKEVDTVLHLSAAVDWVRDYGGLRRTNVEGVRHIIAFACQGHAKRIVFSSSIAVCMFNGGPEKVCEETQLLPYLAGMPLGYARAKTVAECLLHQASERGVPVTIVRPPLISGHSETGRSNPKDIFAALLQACIVTGLGPDTDWTFDIAPVDYVARVLTDVPQGDSNCRVINLKQGNARKWINLLTWINLHGYHVRRMASDDWIRHLFTESAARGLMLATQRQYFAGRRARAGESGWVRPFETYLSNGYARVVDTASVRLLSELGIEAPELDIDMLQRYFSDLRRAGVLPARQIDVARRGAAVTDWDDPVPTLALCYPGARRIGRKTGIMNQLAASRDGDVAGVWLVEEPAGPGAQGTIRKVIKLKPNGSLLRDQSAALASAVSCRLGTLFRRYGDPFQLEGSGERERSIYRAAPGGLAPLMPRVYDADRVIGPGQTALALEYLPEAETAGPATWIRSTDLEFSHVLEGMADVHAAGTGQAGTLSRRYGLVSTPSIGRMKDMMPLWEELAQVARNKLREAGGASAGAMHLRAIRSLADWWPRYLDLPQTLIHNDFNPRNFILRKNPAEPKLCLFDWEIAASGPAQRDLAELLCFCWRSGAGPLHLDYILGQSRDLLQARVGEPITDRAWRDGFHLALQHVLITRLPLYVLADDLETLPFLTELFSNFIEIFEHASAGVGLGHT